MEHKESLKTSAGIGKPTDTIENGINNLLSSSVVATSVVVGSVFFSTNDLLRVIKRLVGTRADCIADRRLQIHKNGTWDMSAGSGLAKKSRERVIVLNRGVNSVQVYGSIGADTVLQAV
jgi:hypothetical protein